MLNRISIDQFNSTIVDRTLTPGTQLNDEIFTIHTIATVDAIEFNI